MCLEKPPGGRCLLWYTVPWSRDRQGGGDAGDM